MNKRFLKGKVSKAEKLDFIDLISVSAQAGGQ